MTMSAKLSCLHNERFLCVPMTEIEIAFLFHGDGFCEYSLHNLTDRRAAIEAAQS